jgi:iron complex transport system ATP-binding protein
MSLTATKLCTGFHKKGFPLILHENINFITEPGELILLAGRNGIGKSVFLKTLAGIINPISGNLNFNEESLFSQKNKQPIKKVAYMLATPPQVELMTPLDIILTATSKGSFFQSSTKKDINEACEILDFWNVLHLKDRSFQELSDGEKQKIMLSRCLVQKSPVVLLDEPTAFLDYPAKIDFWNKIKQWTHQNETTFIVCTHDLPIALNQVHRIWLMNKNQFRIFQNPENFQIEWLND